VRGEGLREVGNDADLLLAEPVLARYTGLPKEAGKESHRDVAFMMGGVTPVA
jgi:hypothetical protein